VFCFLGLAVMSVMFFMVMLFVMMFAAAAIIAIVYITTVGSIRAVMAFPVTMATVFGKNIAQQATGGSAAQRHHDIAFRQYGARGSAQASTQYGVGGFPVGGRSIADYGQSH